MNRRIEARRLDEIGRQKRAALGGRSQAAIDLQQLRDGSHGLEPQLPAVRRTHRQPVQRYAANVDFARAEHDALGVVQAWTREGEYRFRRLREARRGRGLHEERERAAVLIDVEGVVRGRVRADQGEPGRRRRRGLRRQRIGELEEDGEDEDHMGVKSTADVTSRDALTTVLFTYRDDQPRRSTTMPAAPRRPGSM